jgi:hypothetical protein
MERDGNDNHQAENHLNWSSVEEWHDTLTTATGAHGFPLAKNNELRAHARLVYF